MSTHSIATRHSGWLSARFTDLAIKFLVKRQNRRLSQEGFPKLAVIPSEHVGLAVTAGGLYESDEIALIRKLVNTQSLGSSIMLDIGGNIGNHACALAQDFSRIVAFEPNPPVAALLRANALMNGFDNVAVHEVGLAEQDAELPFGIAEAGNDGSGSFAAGMNSKTLPVRRGDAYLARMLPEIAANGQRIGFIKCDVQGFERDVFAGLRQTLTAHQPIIMFESENHADGQASWSVLSECGYSHLAQIRSPGDNKGKLEREWARFRQGTACWLESIASIPDHHCNLIVSAKPLMDMR